MSKIISFYWNLQPNLSFKFVWWTLFRKKVNRQPSNDLKFNRQPSKRLIFNRQPSKGLPPIETLLQRIWKQFCGISLFTENTCATLLVQVTRDSKIWLWIFNACFTQFTSSKIERSFGFDWFFFFSVRFRSIVEVNRTQSMSWVRFSSIGFDWNLVLLGSIYYAGE